MIAPTEVLKDWIASVEGALPQTCPNCGQALDEIRYAYDRDEMRIHLTGVTWENDYCVAECPNCKYELVRQSVGGRRAFWR